MASQSPQPNSPPPERGDQESSLLDQLLRLGVRHIRRFVILVVGVTVLIVGIIMLVTPGPAVVVIPLGLGILGMEFAWARQLLKRFKQRAESLRSDVSSWFKKGEEPPTAKVEPISSVDERGKQ